MTRQDLTHICVVLDRSGSMSSCKAGSEEALNGFIDDQRLGDGSVRLTLVKFDDRYEMVYMDKPLNMVDPVCIEPRGGTALLDAVGRTIIELGLHFANQPEEARPGAVLFVIQTDGEENLSQKYDWAHVSAMIARQREQYNWKFVFLGADQDAIATASRMGMAASSALSYTNTRHGNKSSYGKLSEKTMEMRTSSAMGGTVYCSFDPEDQQEVATASGLPDAFQKPKKK